MIHTLSDDLQQALAETVDAPVRVVHPGTQQIYFLVSAEQYERLRPLFEDVPLSTNEQRFLLEQAGKRAGWDDPLMDDYDHYDEHRPST